MDSTVAIYKICEAIVEKAVIPLAKAGQMNGSLRACTKLFSRPNPPPMPDGSKELREALEKSERESIVFGADLGTVSTFNRGKLSAAFSAGLKNS